MTVANYSATDRATNDLITNTVWNQDVVDNTKFLHSPPGAVATITVGPQSIPDATPTAVEFAGTDEFDTDSIHDPSTNNTRLTCNTAGLYFVSGFVRLTGSNAGDTELYIQHSGGDKVASETHQQTSFVSDVYVNVSGFVQLAATEYVELYVDQTNGAAENVVAARFGMHWIANGAATP